MCVYLFPDIQGCHYPGGGLEGKETNETIKALKVDIAMRSEGQVGSTYKAEASKYTLTADGKSSSPKDNSGRIAIR